MPRIKVFENGQPYEFDPKSKTKIPWVEVPPVSPIAQVSAASPVTELASPAAAIKLPASTPAERGVIVFRYLAELANAGNPTGVGYGDFWAITHGKATFQEAEGRSYESFTDTGRVLALAFEVTKTNGGRIPVTRHGVTIETGMDTYIWNRSAERPDGAFGNLPYTKNNWLIVFPNGHRRMADVKALLRAIVDGSGGGAVAVHPTPRPNPPPQRTGRMTQNLVTQSPKRGTQETLGIDVEWEDTDNDDSGSLFTGETRLAVGDVIEIEGEGKQRGVTYVMGSDRKGWRACFKGQGAVPSGAVRWRRITE